MSVIKRLIYFVLSSLRWAMPGPLKTLIKNTAELKFQRGYVKTFRENIPIFEEHFRKYRYFDEMEKTLNIGPKTRSLDVGCGISTVLHFITGERYGLDPLAKEYTKIYNYPEGINVRKGLSEDIPFEDGYFDVVFCTNVLDHVDDPFKTVAEVWRVLKPGGYFMLTVEIFAERVRRDPAHPHLFMKEDIGPLLGGRFETLFEKASPMMDLKRQEDGELTLVESSKSTIELAFLLKRIE